MKKNIIMIIAQVILIIISLMLQIIREQFFSRTLFWALYLSIVFVTFFLMFNEKDKYKLLALIFLDIFIFSLFAFNYPLFYQVDRDTGFETQVAEIMIEEKMWSPEKGTGFAEDYYGYNPTIHIILSFLSIISGISPVIIAKYFLPGILRIIILISSFYVFKLVFSKQYVNLAYLSTFIFLISPRLRILNISRRIMGVIFVLSTIILILTELKNNKSNNLLFTIFSLFIVISDHSISILFFLFLISGTVFFQLNNLLYKKKNNLPMQFFIKTLIYVILIFFWEGIVSPRLMGSNINYINGITSFIFQLFSRSQGSNLVVPAPFVYSTVQTILIYGSQLLMGFFAFFVLFKLFLKKFELKFFSNKDFSTFIMVFGIILYGISLAISRTMFSNFTNVFIWFSLIGISILLASFAVFYYSVIIMNKKLKLFFALVIISVIYVGGLLLNYHPVIFYPKEHSEMIVEFSAYKNNQIYESGNWLSSNTDGNVIIGDRSVFDIYSGYFRFNSVLDAYAQEMYLSNLTYFERRYLIWPVWIGSYKEIMRREKIDYIIINTDLKKLQSYMFGSPLEKEYFNKFDLTNKTNRVYDNSLIIIYSNLVEDI